MDLILFLFIMYMHQLTIGDSMHVCDEYNIIHILGESWNIIHTEKKNLIYPFLVVHKKHELN